MQKHLLNVEDILKIADGFPYASVKVDPQDIARVAVTITNVNTGERGWVCMPKRRRAGISDERVYTAFTQAGFDPI